MAKIDVLDLSGKKIESVELNATIFDIEPNKQALYDAIIMQKASLRQGTHKTKERNEISGGGRKPWRQKGTGRARQGTIRAPQWRGGGTVFGPTPRSYNYKINKKVRKLAIKSALASKYQLGELVVVEDIKFDTPKTKVMIDGFAAIDAVRKPLLITDDYDENVFLSVRNIPGAINVDASGINVLDVVDAHKLVITKSALTKIEEVLG